MTTKQRTVRTTSIIPSDSIMASAAPAPASLPQPQVTINTEFEFQNQEVIESSARQVQQTSYSAAPITYFRVVNPVSAAPVSPGFVFDATSIINPVIISSSASPSSPTPFLTPSQPVDLDETSNFIENNATSEQIDQFQNQVSASLTPTPPIPASSSITIVPTSMDQDSIFFGENSLLTVPINQEMSEKTVGLELQRWEKPSIISVASEVFSSGYSQNNIVFIKKLISPRATVRKYIIYRKDVFKEVEYKKIAELASNEVNLPLKYIGVISSLGFSKGQVFAFQDVNLKRNSTYLYKIEVVWSSNGQPPSPEFDPSIIFTLATSGTFAWNFIT